MPRLFKRKQSYNVAKNSFVAKIYLLDNTTVDFNLLPEVTGRDCLEKVAQCLDIQEVRRTDTLLLFSKPQCYAVQTFYGVGGSIRNCIAVSLFQSHIKAEVKAITCISRT